jgi:hypothetical protein
VVCRDPNDIRAQIWKSISPWFEEREDGTLHNPTLSEEMRIAEEITGKKVEAGRIGGKASGEARRKQSLSNNEATVGIERSDAQAQVKQNRPTNLPTGAEALILEIW